MFWGIKNSSLLRSFDREKQKEYLVPIVIKDSGMSGSMSGMLSQQWHTCRYVQISFDLFTNDL